MDFGEVFDDVDRLWFFSNVLSATTPSPVTDSDHGYNNVHERVQSWLEDSVEAAIAANGEEECEEELEKEEDALEDEFTQGLENAEQSTLIAMLMSAPLNSVKTAADSGRGRKKGGTGRRKVKSVKNEIFERKRSVLREIQSGYFPHSVILPERDQFWGTPFGKPMPRKTHAF